MASVTKDAIRQATVTAGVKANAKEAADLATFVAPLIDTLKYGVEGMQAEGRFAALRVGAGAETGRGTSTSPYTLTEHSMKVRQLLL